MRNDIGIFPLTCDKYIPTRVKAIMATWGSFCQDNVIFIGDKEVKDSKTGKVRQFNCLDPKHSYPELTDNRYEDAPHKLFNALRKLAGSDWKWLFFCDDDTYVKVHLLEEYIISLESKGDTNDVYSLDMIACYAADRSLSYPSGGAGYLMTRATLNKIVPFLDTVPYSKPDRWGDVMLGYAMREAGVRVKDEGRFFEMNEEMEWKEWQWTRGGSAKQPAITYHYMDPDRMLHFHDVLINKMPIYYRKNYYSEVS